MMIMTIMDNDVPWWKTAGDCGRYVSERDVCWVVVDGQGSYWQWLLSQLSQLSRCWILVILYLAILELGWIRYIDSASCYYCYRLLLFLHIFAIVIIMSCSFSETCEMETLTWLQSTRTLFARPDWPRPQVHLNCALPADIPKVQRRRSQCHQYLFSSCIV